MFVHCCLVKFITEQIPLELQRKTTLNFIFKDGKQKKNQKFLKQMSFKTLAKDPSNYEGREVEKNKSSY